MCNRSQKRINCMINHFACKWIRIAKKLCTMCTSKQALQKTFFKAPSQSVLTFVFTFGYLGKNQEGGEKYVGREKTWQIVL